MLTCCLIPKSGIERKVLVSHIDIAFFSWVKHFFSSQIKENFYGPNITNAYLRASNMMYFKSQSQGNFSIKNNSKAY